MYSELEHKRSDRSNKVVKHVYFQAALQVLTVVLEPSFSYSEILMYSHSEEQPGHLKGCFSALLCAGSFYYGHHPERQKPLLG